MPGWGVRPLFERRHSVGRSQVDDGAETRAGRELQEEGGTERGSVLVKGMAPRSILALPLASCEAAAN